MNYRIQLRPEDFRETWANAYQLAVIQVGDMHRRADIQLALSNKLIKESAENTETSRKRLLRTAQVFVKQIEGSNDRCISSITAATTTLVERANALFVSGNRRHDETQALIRQLEEDRQRLERLRAQLFDQPLWRRIWNALKFRG